VLDEPMAMLDPLARHDFMAAVMTAVADDGVSVLLSSHVLAELERVADYLVLMSRGSVQVAGEVEDLLASHRVLTGPAARGRPVRRNSWSVVHARHGGAQAHLLVRTNGATDLVPPGWEAIRSAWKSSPWPTCASPAPRRCQVRARARNARPTEVTNDHAT
jgi:ABC-2 type transport system ATP-binding protein